MTDTEPVEKFLYTPAEAAMALGVSTSTIYVLMAGGDVPSVRIGSCRRVPVDGLRRYVASLARKEAAVPAATHGQAQLWS